MAISAAQWRDVFQLLDTALDLDPLAQEKWLREIAATRGDLLAPLQAMLRDRTRIEKEQLISDPIANLRMPPVLAAGSLIGPYRLLRTLGRGGMGEVWLCERADGQLDRRVALKLPNTDWSRADLAVRFARERQILSALEHPHIARLYDAGVTADGQPYLVLEFVDGTAIDTYCDTRRLDIRARLKLFMQILEAVKFAHSRLVIHRDLKPANILVTDDAQVRLLDFGIAKLLLEETGRAPETKLTQMSGRALTPQYASPEQVSGGAVTTSSDVYSLGVILYQLLCGSLPYELARGSAAELEEAILSAEPKPLHANLTEAAAAARGSTKSVITRQLRSDLEAIVYAALQKDTALRYGTADALMQDVRNYLDHLPVTVRGVPLLARVGRAIRRNKIAFGAAASVFLALALGLSVAVFQARRAEQQAAVAQAEAQKSAFISAFLLDIFNANSKKNADPLKAQQTTALQLLDTAAARLTTMPPGSPDSYDELLRTVGNLYGDLSAVDTTIALRKRRLDVARKSFAPSDPRLTEAMLQYGGSLYDSGGWKQAIGVLQEADAQLVRNGDNLSATRARLDSLLGEYWRGTDLLKARHYALRAVDLYAKKFPDSPDYVAALLGAGLVEAAAINIRASEKWYALAVGTHERLRLPEAGRVQTLVMLAEAQSDLQKGAAAEKNFLKGLEISRRVNGVGHIDTLQTMMRYGIALRRMTRYREAQSMLLQAQDAAVASLGESETFHLPSIRLELAVALLRVGRLEEASRVAQRAIEVREKSRPGTAQHVTMLQFTAMIRVAQGDLAEASTLLAHAREFLQKIGSPIYKTRQPGNEAATLIALGRPRDALAVLDAAKEAARAANAAEDLPLECAQRLERARALIALQLFTEAEALLETNRRIASTATDPAYFAGIDNDSSLSLGLVWLRSGKIEQSVTLLRDVRTWRLKNLDANSPAIIEVDVALAKALANSSATRAEARLLLREAAKIAKSHPRLGKQYAVPHTI